MNKQAERISETITAGFEYAKTTLQNFWPAKQGMLNNKKAEYINAFSENNLTLHVGRAFAENGFLVWAEVPFYTRPEGLKSDLTLDFLAYDKNTDTAVMIEFKNNIDTPQGVFNDIYRFTCLQQTGNGLCHDAETGNGMCIHKAKHKFYVIVTVLNQGVFHDWWEKPKNKEANSYMPFGKRAPLYGVIGKILNDFSLKKDFLRMEIFHPSEKDCAIAYAIFPAREIDTLSQSTVFQQGLTLIGKAG